MSSVQAVVFSVHAHSKESAMEAVKQDGQGINAIYVVQQIVSEENVTWTENVLYVSLVTSEINVIKHAQIVLIMLVIKQVNA